MYPNRPLTSLQASNLPPALSNVLTYAAVWSRPPPEHCRVLGEKIELSAKQVSVSYESFMSELLKGYGMMWLSPY